MPEYIWGDTAPHLCSGVGLTSLRRDGDRWKRMYEDDVQYKGSRLQHHVHRKDARGQRQPLKACIPKSGKKECKSGFPKDKELNEDKPLLLCKGLARARGLPTSGTRGCVGQTLGRRTCVWKNGTSRAFPAALCWANSDVSPNYRLPISGKHTAAHVLEIAWQRVPCAQSCVRFKRAHIGAFLRLPDQATARW